MDHGKQSLPPRLTVSQVALLALRNNRDLLAIRAQHGVAQAQVLQAGLLPNPQVSSALLPLVAGVGTTSAWNVGISEDIRSLIALSSTKRAARFGAEQIDAQILWQEWQVIGQTRLLAVDIIETERILALLAHHRDLLAARYGKSQQLLVAGFSSRPNQAESRRDGGVPRRASDSDGRVG